MPSWVAAVAESRHADVELLVALRPLTTEPLVRGVDLVGQGRRPLAQL